VGILSDRVLGMPVAAAYSSTLPQNCCVQLCGKGMDLSRDQRAMVGRCCFVAALNLLMLGAVSDALGSNTAVWQASSRGTSQMLQLPDSQAIIPEYYLGTCINTGKAPVSVQVSFWFGACAIFLVTLTVATALYVGRSCELCCVPCNFWSCDMPCRNSFSLALSLLFTAIAIPLNAWPCTWLWSDMTNCGRCHSEGLDAATCASGFHLEYQVAGILSTGGIAGGLAAALAGFYALSVPLAIKAALRSKSSHVEAIQGSISLNNFLSARANAAPPNLVPSQRNAAISEASRSVINTPVASPYITNVNSPSYSSPHRAASSASAQARSPIRVFGQPPPLSLEPPATLHSQYAGLASPAISSQPSPMLSVTARSSPMVPPSIIGRSSGTPIMTATPVANAASPLRAPIPVPSPSPSPSPSRPSPQLDSVTAEAVFINVSLPPSSGGSMHEGGGGAETTTPSSSLEPASSRANGTPARSINFSRGRFTVLESIPSSPAGDQTDQQHLGDAFRPPIAAVDAAGGHGNLSSNPFDQEWQESSA